MTLFSLGLLDNVRGPYFADIISDLNLSNTQGSLFFAVVSGMAFVAAQVVPFMASRFSLLNVIRMALVTMGVGFYFIAYAHSLSVLLLFCVIFGLGFGVLNVAQNLLILEGSSLYLRRRLFSGLHGMYAFSSLIAPLIAAQLFQLQINWRVAFMGFASIVIVSLIVSFFARSEKSILRPHAPVRNLQRVKFKSYSSIGGVLSLYVLAELVLSTRLSLYVRQTYMYSPAQAANLLALFFLFLLVGRFIFLFIPFKSSNLVIIERCLVCTFVAYILGLWVHPWLFALAGFTMAPIFGLSIDLVAEMFPEHSSQAVSNVIGLSCIYIVSMHIVMGLLSDWIGITQAMSIGLVFIFSAWLLLKRRRHED